MVPERDGEDEDRTGEEEPTSSTQAGLLIVPQSAASSGAAALEVVPVADNTASGLVAQPFTWTCYGQVFVLDEQGRRTKRTRPCGQVNQWSDSLCTAENCRRSWSTCGLPTAGATRGVRRGASKLLPIAAHPSPAPAAAASDGAEAASNLADEATTVRNRRESFGPCGTRKARKDKKTGVSFARAGIMKPARGRRDGASSRRGTKPGRRGGGAARGARGRAVAGGSAQETGPVEAAGAAAEEAVEEAADEEVTYRAIVDREVVEAQVPSSVLQACCCGRMPFNGHVRAHPMAVI